jgi:hypothetical protein
MVEWIPCTDGFIEADIIRWQEAIWERRASRNNKGAKIGSRMVTAEVLRDDTKHDWVRLLVRGCVLLERFTQKDTVQPKNGDEITRKRATILRGKPERLLWSDEDNRSKLVMEGRARRGKSGHPNSEKPV